MNILVINDKGGVGKSFISMQVLAPFFLYKNEEVKLLEFDNENNDSDTFVKTILKKEQIVVDSTVKELNTTLRNVFLEKNNSLNFVCDIGGNRTCNLFLQSLKETYIFNCIDLFVIPISNAYQDLINANKVYESVSKYNKKIIFALSRSRHSIDNPRVKFQYSNFFKTYPNMPYIILQDDDCVDLSRALKRTIWEISQDEDEYSNISLKLKNAFDDNDMQSVYNLSQMLEILDDSKAYLNTNILKAFETLEVMLYGK
jgi:nitrogenase subunit NifH